MSNLGQIETTEFRVTLFTSAFQARGALHVPAALQTYLNNESQATMSVFNVEVLGLEASNPARMTQPEIIVNKRACQIILFESTPAPGSVAILPRFESLVAYVDGFAVAGKYYMGQDSRLNDFAESSMQQFLLVSDMRLYPIIQARPGLVLSAPMGIVHKGAIHFFHRG